jgi:hypothetical protein
MAMKYYNKEILSNEARVGDGRPLRFEDIGDGDGIIKTDDQNLIDLIKPLVDGRVGGVREITEKEYEEFSKKKADSPQPKRQSRKMSDPPAYPNQPVSIDQREAVAGSLTSTGPKRYGFGGTAPEGAVQAKEPTTTPSSEPTAPSGDPVINRPTPKKVSTKTAPPEGNLFP